MQTGNESDRLVSTDCLFFKGHSQSSVTGPIMAEGSWGWGGWCIGLLHFLFVRYGVVPDLLVKLLWLGSGNHGEGMES